MSRLAVILAAALLAPAVAPLGAGAQAAPSAGAPLTLRQQAGQRVVFGFAGPRPPASLLRRIARGEGAGVILFARHLGSASAVRRLTTRLRSAGRRSPVAAPLLIMVDQEGGRVSRLPGAPRRSPAALGATGDPGAAEAEGRATAANLRRGGFNVNLAPLVDLGRPGGVVRRLGRAYGARADLVARMGTAFVRGLAAGGVAGCFKHFPGIGSAPRDEDAVVNVLRRPLNVLRAADQAPFAAGVAAGVSLVMTATAAYPALDDARTPAMFSRPVVTGELRERLGFAGVALTDDLQVPAVGRFGPPGRRALLAAGAGNDLLLFAQDEAAGAAAVDALEEAYASGRLPRAEHEASVARVLALRASL